MNRNHTCRMAWHKLAAARAPSQRHIRTRRCASLLHQAIFAAPSCDNPHEYTALKYLFPDDTKAVGVNGVEGWLYHIYDAYGTRYTMFAYHDAHHYQVQVVFPAVERSHDAAMLHLTADGRLQPTGRDGFSTLHEAFRSSVSWASHFGMFMRWSSADCSQRNQ